MKNTDEMFAMLVAAGSGTRFGGDTPKQFLDLLGREVFLWSLDTLAESAAFEEIVLLVPQGWEAHAEQMIFENKYNGVDISVVAGGKTRSDSLAIGIDHIAAIHGITNKTIFLTHDAVRPFLTRRMIDESLGMMGKFEAVTVAVEATDSIAISRSGTTVDSREDRSEVYQIQTPQTFRAARYLELIKKVRPYEAAAFTDATGVFSFNGYPVGILPGVRENIKITEPIDFEIARAIGAIMRE